MKQKFIGSTSSQGTAAVKQKKAKLDKEAGEGIKIKAKLSESTESQGRGEIKGKRIRSQTTSSIQGNASQEIAVKKLKTANSQGNASLAKAVLSAVKEKDQRANEEEFKKESKAKAIQSSPAAACARAEENEETTIEEKKSKRQRESEPQDSIAADTDHPDFEASQTLRQIGNKRFRKKSYKQLLSESTTFQKVKEERVHENNETSQPSAGNKKHKGKYDKDKLDWLHPRKPLNMIKSGMEVGLTSPNSEKLVALGTVQKVATDDYIEVVVNMVLHSATLLPEPRGRMKIIRHAEAHCIRWPKKFVTEPDIDRYTAKMCNSMDRHLMLSEVRVVDPKTGISKPTKPKI